jgi:hypothetical protein
MQAVMPVAITTRTPAAGDELPFERRAASGTTSS